MDTQTDLLIELTVSDARVLSADPCPAPGMSMAEFTLHTRIENNSENVVVINGRLQLRLFDPDGNAIEPFFVNGNKNSPVEHPLNPGEKRTLHPVQCTVNGMPIRADEKYAVRVTRDEQFEECEFEFEPFASTNPR